MGKETQQKTRRPRVPRPQTGTLADGSLTPPLPVGGQGRASMMRPSAPPPFTSTLAPAHFSPRCGIQSRMDSSSTGLGIAGCGVTPGRELFSPSALTGVVSPRDTHVEPQNGTLFGKGIARM